MMPAIDQFMLAATSSLAASILTKVTLIAALGLIGAALARRGRAAVRHSLLAATFGALLALPAVSLLAPPIRVTLPAAPQSKVATGGVRSSGATRTLNSRLAATLPARRSTGITTSELLLLAWAAGALLLLLPVATGLWQVGRLRRTALPWPEQQATVAGRPVQVLLHEALPGPMTCGIVHPAIVLPRDARTWPAEDLERALVHELEHVRRADWLTHCLARAVCAAYWFHPFVWMAWRRLLLDAERSCDDAVLRRSEATAYADQLVGLAQRLSGTAKSPLPAMANRADLAKRVGAVLDGRQARGRAGRLAVAAACVGGAVLLAAISPLRVVEAQQTGAAVVSPADLPQFSISTMLVIVDATVHDPGGRAIEGLTAGDFAVTEDGAPQQIAVFEFQRVTNAQGVESSYYVLGYYSANKNQDGDFRKIKVLYKGDASNRLNYRQGYYSVKGFARAGSTAQTSAGASSPALDGTAPVLLSKVEPLYSEEARKAKHQGTVVLYLTVSDAGQPSMIRVLRSLGLGLDESAVQAVQKWTFHPAMKNGQPIAMPVIVTLNFRLM